jgi:methylase of polypeptide subunit release factors
VSRELARSEETTVDFRQAALVALGRMLAAEGYRFVTATPETHRRVLARAGRDEARDLRDVFGFSRPFPEALLPARMLEAMRAARVVERRGALLASTVRWSSLGEALYVHSAHPTSGADAVFFGPDTYRFAAFLEANARAAESAIDIGCGTGAGGLSIATRVARLTLSDVNRAALRLARVNATLAGITNARFIESDVMNEVAGTFDLVIANPPYLVDDEARTYRHGGSLHGAELSVRIVREALDRLSSRGTLLLYTGAPIVEGRDVFLDAVRPVVGKRSMHYTELDPDVFGEELDRPAYADVERIAVVGLRIDVP